MTYIWADILGVAAIGRKRTFKNVKEFVRHFVFLISLLTLSGCVTSDISQPLAPEPPGYSSSYSYSLSFAAAHDPTLESGLTDFVPDYSFAVEEIDRNGVGETGRLNVSDEKKSMNCRFRDRFDRKALMSYHWDRSKLSMDVDGINMRSSGDDFGVRVEYKLRLQPEKPQNKKTLCREHLKFQGLIGTGYHEFFERDHDTVWDEVRGLRKQMSEYLGGTR